MHLSSTQSAPPELGRAIRQTRKELGLTLDQVSARSGISKSMLSQIERGLVNPTFAVVWNLTQALSLDLNSLMGGAMEDKRRVVEHVRPYSTPVKMSADGKCSLRLLSPKRTVLPVEWYDVRFERSGVLSSDAHATGTYEHLTCLEGALELEVAGLVVQVACDETVRYYADQPHAIRNCASLQSRALLMIALPAQYASERL